MDFRKNFLVLLLILVGASNISFVCAKNIRKIGKQVSACDMKKVTFGHPLEDFKIGEIVAAPAQEPAKYIYGEVEEKYDAEYEEEGKKVKVKSVSVIVEKDGNIYGINTHLPERLGKF